MEFYFPTEFGEQLAFWAAAISAVIGLVVMFAPGLTFRMFGLSYLSDRRDGLVLLRSSLGGFYLGFGASALLLAQPWSTWHSERLLRWRPLEQCCRFCLTEAQLCAIAY